MEIYKRLKTALILLAVVFLIGTIGFRFVNAERASWIDAAYMTVVTITSVGFEEIVPLETNFAKIFAMAYMLVGLGLLLYVITTATALVIEGDLRRYYLQKRTGRMVRKMKDHSIVCGIGRQGTVVIQEFVRTGHPFVMVEGFPGRIDELHELYPNRPIVVGDATDEDILKAAGIETAKSLVCCLSEDRDNLLLVVTAKQIRPDLHVIAKVMEIPAMKKIQQVGADTVVSPTLIGGMRMASDVIRPTVNNFLDRMMRDKERTLRFEEVVIPEGSHACGKTLSELDPARKAGLIVLATKEANSEQFNFAPSGDTIIKESMTLIVLGDSSNVPKLRDSVA